MEEYFLFNNLQLNKISNWALPSFMKYITPSNQEYARFSELPLDELDRRKYGIYVIDYEWTYIFINEHVRELLGNISVIGKTTPDVWKDFPHLNFQPLYILIKDAVDSKSKIILKSTSPLSNKKVEIQGTPLSDCYYFSIRELPDKDAVISELRAYLKKG